MRYTYAIDIEECPAVMRHCARCGERKPFAPSGQIRVNAQKKLLDVWLIHRCRDCGQTWNMEVFSRVPPGRLDRMLYEKLLTNDRDLVRALAFDPGLHARSDAPLCADTLRYEIKGEAFSWETLEEPAEVVLTCPVPLGVRLSKLLREILGLSAGAYEAMTASGAISSPDVRDLMKARMETRCMVRVLPR